MGRRKTIFYGQMLDERFQTALGFPEHERFRDILSEIDYEIPKINWGKIANKIDQEIPQYSKQEIDFAFEAELGFRVRKAIANHMSGDVPEDETSETDFLKKSARIENLARRLTEEIDELAELGTQLLVRPKPKDGLTSVEKPDLFYSHVSGKTFAPSEDCFFDYFTFRKLLDYFANFSSKNGDFQSIIGGRFDRMLDYTWYETFVRRVVLAFWPTNFPMTITIPTDTNPDFSSPIILVLDEIRQQINQLAVSTPGFADMHGDWTYRQHARLVLKLREEFDKSEIFWALNSLRKYDAEQSAFAEKEF